jgi:hypothetical protein
VEARIEQLRSENGAFVQPTKAVVPDLDDILKPRRLVVGY